MGPQSDPFCPQEVQDLRAQISQSAVTVEVDAPRSQDLGKVLAELRAQYDALAQKNLEDLEKQWGQQVGNSKNPKSHPKIAPEMVPGGAVDAGQCPGLKIPRGPGEAEGVGVGDPKPLPVHTKGVGVLNKGETPFGGCPQAGMGGPKGTPQRREGGVADPGGSWVEIWDVFLGDFWGELLQEVPGPILGTFWGGLCPRGSTFGAPCRGSP